MRSTLALAAFAVFFTVSASDAPAGAIWEHPPQAILDVLNAPELPSAWPSPDGSTLALATALRYPPLADLARPMLRLAGVRVDPRTNGRYAERYFVALRLLRVSDRVETEVELPAGARVSGFEWSSGGMRFAFLNEAADGMELWTGETASGRIRRVDGLRINPLLGSALIWMPDQKSLLVKCVPPGRGAPPAAPAVPAGPDARESAGGSATSTYEARDLLTGPYDEDLFDFYAQSRLALVDAATGAATLIGEAGVLAGIDPSPDGRMVLVHRLRKPWSTRVAFYRFPHDVEVLDLRSGKVSRVASLPLADHVPIHGEPEGPRSHAWRPGEPATLVWVEALDGGDPAAKVAHRDRILAQKAPFDRPARTLYTAAHRVSGWWWGAQDGLLLVQEWERERRWRHVWALHPDASRPAPKQIIDLSENDRYADPGYPLQRRLQDGHSALVQDKDMLFFAGSGATPSGDRPFVDRLSLTTGARERIFRSDEQGYELFAGWAGPATNRLLTRRESPLDPPNYFVRTITTRKSPSSRSASAGDAVWNSETIALTHFTDPTPQIRGISKRIVTYRRADGTPLSFTLYLPPGYQEGTRLPTVLEAYPLEYSDPSTAGQVSGTDREFTRLLGPTPLFFLLDGYAVLEGVAMPVIGDPDTAYDTFIEQLVADAQAAVRKAAAIGVTDSNRVGIIGHSHGALMVATLLAHSDIFRAGIARSGAYNHTLRPFGFQSERRTLWQAPETYVRISPLMHADHINEPLLLIHGAADQNPGTVPMQSEKLFDAVRGTGGTVRLVMLPFEQHGYQSREAVEQVLTEQLRWFGRNVKGTEGHAD